MQASLGAQSLSIKQPFPQAPPIQLSPFLQSLALRHFCEQIPETQASPQSQSRSRLQFLRQKPLVQTSLPLHPPDNFRNGLNLFLKDGSIEHCKALEKQLANGSPPEPTGQEHCTS